MDEHAGTVGRFALGAAQPARRVPIVPAGVPLDERERRVRDAVDDLADRLGVDAAAVRVVEARAVTWGDTSCGCPQPDMNYLQRLVDGAWVLLEVRGRRYDYRGGTTMRWCADATAPAPAADAARAGQAPDRQGPDPL